MKKEEMVLLTEKYNKLDAVVRKYNELVQTQEHYERILEKFERHGSIVTRFIPASSMIQFSVGTTRDMQEKLGLAIKDVYLQEIEQIKKELEELEYHE